MTIPVAIDPQDLANRFTYHPPQPGQPQLYEEIRARALDYAQYLVQVCPPGRDTSLAITHLEDAVFRANAAIARATPKDNPFVPEGFTPGSAAYPPLPAAPTAPVASTEIDPPRTDIPLHTPPAGAGG